MKLRIAPDAEPCLIEVDMLAVRVLDAVISVLAYPEMLDASSLEWLFQETAGLRRNAGSREEIAVIDSVAALLRRHLAGDVAADGRPPAGAA